MLTRMKHFAPALLAAAALLGPMVGHAAEPRLEQRGGAQAKTATSGSAAQRGSSADDGERTSWACFTSDGTLQGVVTIWWGNTSRDAKWACDNWIPACGNAPGGCFPQGPYPAN